jgi:GAF domain-containing protein
MNSANLSGSSYASNSWLDNLLLNDCEPDEQLDSLTRDVAKLFKVPLAMINLVTADEIIFKACVGEIQGKKIERSGAFCSLAVTSEETLMIPDAHLDPRFKHLTAQ